MLHQQTLERLSCCSRPRRSNQKSRAHEEAQCIWRHSRSSLCKHFNHWIKAPLLPASLIAEAPVANVVAAAMRNEDPAHGMLEDQMTVKMPFVSNMQKQIVDAKAFWKFLHGRLETIQGDNDHTAESINAAELVLEKLDMRSFDCNVRLDMHSTDLPLANQTQFVDSVVKEAKHVSQTDWSEQQRSCHVVV